MYTHRLIVYGIVLMRMIYECKCRDNCTCVHIHITIGVAKNISSTHNFMTTVKMEIRRLQAKYTCICIGVCMHFRFPAVNILGVALPYLEPYT